MIAPRRAFLQGLAALPLIGGSVAIIGKPTAVAQPIDRYAMLQYANWLFYERRLLCLELAGGDARECRVLEALDGPYTPEFHFPRFGRWEDVAKPSTRAALVMSAVGFDWREAA